MNPSNRPSDPDLEAALFALALEKSPAERPAFLAAMCGENDALHRHLEALLSVHGQPDSLLETPDNADLPTIKLDPAPEPPDEAVGQRLGRYKLLERVGEGGCGVVYVAEQTQPVRRRVALKVIKLGMDTKQVVARFEAERQALAMMDHPNIAKVLDAGMTGEKSEVRSQNPAGKASGASLPAPDSCLLTSGSGRPYFVMELVRGIRITDYCDQANLSTKERLDLFIKVCQAIQHAHQKGIIHRDIKPSNILVTLHDGVPVPKVIDFGIAKATEGRLTDHTVYTQLQQFIGTPAYMSPEQAEMSGLDIDTRSDIYSLGVLLYELLAGSTPFDAKELMASGIDAMRKTIREKEPQRPSTKLSQTLVAADVSPRKSTSGLAIPTAEEISADSRRRLRLKEQIARVKGDLDWIVMKCLEKDRSRRYDTANGLAADLKRHLDNEPVTARPPSTAYRFQKAFRRNKLAFSAATVVALALVGLMVSIVVFSVLFGREQQRTAATLRSSLAGEYLRRGQSLCLEGKVTEGLHWMVRSLVRAPADQTNLIAVVRQNLGSWTAVRNRPLAVVYQKALLYAAAYSPVEDRVVLGGMENSLQMYSATTGEPIGPVMPHSKSVHQAVFSPNGKFIASMDGKAWLWLAADGRPAFSSLGPTQGMKSVAFSPDSRRLLIAGDNRAAQQWSVETGQAIGPSMTHTATVMSARFSVDGRWIATACADKTARLWNAETGVPVSPPLRHEDGVTEVAFSPDGRLLATLGKDRTVRLWSVNRGESIAPPIRHNGVVKAMAFSTNSQRLLTGSEDGFARLWNLSGEPVGSPMRHEGGVLAVTFTPDGKRVLTGGRDRAARFWSAETGEPLGQPLEHDGWVAEIHFSRDGSKVLGRTYGHSAAIWSAHLGTAPDVELKEQPLLAGVFSPDGQRLLTGNILGEARIWSAETGEPTGVVVKHRLWNVAYSPDGQLFLTAGRDGLVKLWSAATGEPLGEPLIHPAEVRAAVFSHDGKRVATACFDQTARVWSVATRQPIGAPLVHSQLVEDVDFSPDDARLVTAGSDGRALIWSVASGQLALPPLEHRSAVLGAVFSPDGRRILTGSRDATARLWDAATGQPVGTPMLHPDWVEEVAFSPDGQTILTGSNDGGARQWSAMTGQLLGPPVLNHGPVMDVQFSPDGQRAIASSQAKIFWAPQGPTFRGAKIWRVPEIFTGRIEVAERWVESFTGMSLDQRGVLSWLEAGEWRKRKQEFVQPGRAQ